MRRYEEQRRREAEQSEKERRNAERREQERRQAERRDKERRAAWEVRDQIDRAVRQRYEEEERRCREETERTVARQSVANRRDARSGRPAIRSTVRPGSVAKTTSDAAKRKLTV